MTIVDLDQRQRVQMNESIDAKERKKQFDLSGRFVVVGELQRFDLLGAQKITEKMKFVLLDRLDQLNTDHL